MNLLENITKPSKEEQRTAMDSYIALAATLDIIKSTNPEIEIEETSERIKIPINVLKLLVTILKEIGDGNPISIVPIATEMTTQAAAELLGCSRPHIVKLLELGSISFTKVGKHRRIKYNDLIKYKKKMKDEQRILLSDIMKLDEESGLYDS